MLFTTAVFVGLFLPLTVVGFFAMRGNETAAAWLLAASLVFYAWWMPAFTLLLIGSITLNFLVGVRIGQAVAATRDAVAKRWMVVGVVGNLGLLAYFKYFNFFADNLSAVLGTSHLEWRVVLPVGISFFTFTQIAFLVDAWRGKVQEHRFIHYGLFVTYFPHLIAGPVLHHGQMMPQFANARTYRFFGAQFAGGMAIFAIGLVKKVVFADGISPYADAVFNPADAGQSPDMAEAWLGAVAYTLQLYFDFSGYSDMAIGLSWMFNIRLPFNFESPYRATDIAAFWRRWHISLSNFLRDYLYIALGGNRRGAWRQQVNLMTTMLLGGLWHGASWSFVFWGGLHGLYLVLHRVFRGLLGEARATALSTRTPYVMATWALTMLAVIVGWVFFRATTFSGALRVVGAMAAGTRDTSVHPLLWNAGVHLSTGAGWCAALAVVALCPVSSNRIGTELLEHCRARPALRTLIGMVATLIVAMLVVVNTARESTSAFIYFNF